MANDGRATRQAAMPWGKHDNPVLVLQGGGALGAYQAGAFEALAGAGFEPDWITGVSIGAINSALIAGNPPERRVERLKEFWDRATAGSPFVPPAALDALRPWFNGISFAGTAAWSTARASSSCSAAMRSARRSCFSPRPPSARTHWASDCPGRSES